MGPRNGLRVVALLIISTLGACSLEKLDGFHSMTERLSPVVDNVLSVVEPRLAVLENASAGLGGAIDQVVERRLRLGQSPEDDLSLKEWMYVAGSTILSTVGGIFGLNTYRSRTRRKDLQLQAYRDRVDNSNPPDPRHPRYEMPRPT